MSFMTYITMVLISWAMFYGYAKLNSIFWWEPIGLLLIITLIPVANVTIIGLLFLKEIMSFVLHWIFGKERY